MVEAIVEHDYVAKELDELTIKKGDVIKDVVKKQAGWCEGVLNDKRGLFPDNFVKLVDREVTLRHRKDPHRVRKCRVIFSYAQDHEDELNLNVGEVIEIIGEEEEGWWKGVLNGKTGVFPSNFVEEIPQVGSKDNSVEDLTNSASDVEQHRTPCLPPKPAKILCEVKFPYKAQNEDELTLKEGDIVTLISKDGQDAGWWRGELNGKIGVFPDNFVFIVDERNPKDDKKPTNTPSTPQHHVKYVASQRKSQEVKPVETRLDPDAARGVPPAVPGKKPSLPIKKSPSGTGSSGGGIFSGLRKKIVDAVDGATVSKAKPAEAKTEETPEHAFDQVERNSMLHDVRASRAKAPGRRPPSVVYKEGDAAPVVPNGNSDYGSLEENLSSSNTSIEQEIAEVRPKVREWEKHKAPWLEEMKLNQAKRTSTSPGPESRNKLTTPDKVLGEGETVETSPVDMSKSMPSLGAAKILKTPPNELEKVGVALRNKPVVNSRPQSIETPKPATKIKTPSPIQKPPVVEKPVLPLPDKEQPVTTATSNQYLDLLDRIGKLESTLEKQHVAHEAAIEDLRGKLQIETELRMQFQAELERISQCVTQV